MVSKTPPVEMLTPETRARMAEMAKTLPDEVHEEPVPNGRLGDLRPRNPGFRYLEREIYDIGLVRMRSLTGKEFEQIKLRDDKWLLVYAVVNEDGKQLIAPEDIDARIEEWDARTYIELLQMANEHCLPMLTIGALMERAEGN